MHSLFINKVRNNRQSILADRPLTIFKANTRKESVFRFFSPPPMPIKKLNEKQSTEKALNVMSNKSIPPKNVQSPGFKSKKRKLPKTTQKSFKKVVMNFAKVTPKNRNFQLKGRLKFGVK